MVPTVNQGLSGCSLPSDPRLCALAVEGACRPDPEVGRYSRRQPATASIAVVDRTTGQKTVIAQGGPWLLRTTPLVRAGCGRDHHRRSSPDGPDPRASRHRSTDRFVARRAVQGPVGGRCNQITAKLRGGQRLRSRQAGDNGAGKIIKVDPVSGVQQLIASGSTCTFFSANAACQNTTTAGSSLAHPYGIAIDYTTSPATLVVADMSSFNGNGAIFRLQAVPNGAQTLLWGPATAVPTPRVSQQSPLASPMGVAVEPNGNILTSVFSYPVPNPPVNPAPSGTFYGLYARGIHRIDLVNSVQSVVNTNAPQWQATRSYAVGEVIANLNAGYVHRVVASGASQDTVPNWNGTVAGTTVDGSVMWQNLGPAANWLIPFGLDAEPAPTPSNPSQDNNHRRGGRLQHDLPAGGEWNVHSVTGAARH